MQTTLLGLAIAFIIALIAALVGPYFIDWNQFRPQFEAEATRIIGAPVRVGGKLDARLLPAPSLQLHSVVVGGANDLGKVRADKLDVEFSLGSLMRGEVARHPIDHQRPVARSRARRAGTYRLAGIHRHGQSGLAGDRPAQSHRPHRPARRGQPLDARTQRYRLQRRRPFAGRLGPRRRQFHAEGHALPVSHLLGAGPRRQRHPRSSQHRPGRPRAAGGSRRRAEFRFAQPALRRRVDARRSAWPEGAGQRSTVADRDEGQGRLFDGAARPDRDELWARRARAEAFRQWRRPVWCGAAVACRAVGAPARCRQILHQGQCRRAGSRAAGVAGARHARSASADPGADRAGIRAGHAGRTSVAGYFRRGAWRRQILEPATAGISRAGRNQGFAQRRRCEQRRHRSFQGRAQRRIVRSGSAADMAAGPWRHGLSQPEDASACAAM